MIKRYERKNSYLFFIIKKERKVGSFFSILNTANCIDIAGNVLLFLNNTTVDLGALYKVLQRFF